MSRYTDLRDLARQELHISDINITDILAATLFDAVLEIYSRFRGKRKVWIQTFSAGIAEYDLDNSIAHIMNVFWNDTYPGTLTTTTESEAITSEKYHNPALAAVDALKKRLQEKYADVDLQHWEPFYNTGTSKNAIYLDPTPETDIVIEYRELFTQNDFPSQDEAILIGGLKWKMCEYILGIAQVKSQGDVTFNVLGMKQLANHYKTDFYGALRTVRGYAG